jgi:uncharacterized protein (TIGR02145 family)
MRYVDGVTGSGAGTKLKATSGWNDYNGSSGNGTDEFGFSALPGGGSALSGGFSNVGDFGSWWSSAEENASIAHSRFMFSPVRGAVRMGTYNKTLLLSVRCVQD